jgi:serine/threonine protein kinase
MASLMRNKIIANGAIGIIVHPPIDSNNSTMVGKIGSYNNLIEEFKILNIIQENEDKDLPCIYNNVSFEEIDIKKVHNLMRTYDGDKNIFEGETILYQLSIPFIEGKSLESFMDINEMFTGDLDEWFKHIQLLLRLRNDITRLKLIGIEHRDIHLGNIMYDENKDRLFLIDFGQAKYFSSNYKIGDEYSDLSELDTIILRYFQSVSDNLLIVNFILTKDLASGNEQEKTMIRDCDKNSIVYNSDQKIIKIKNVSKRIQHYIDTHSNYDNNELLLNIFRHDSVTIFHFDKVKIEKIIEYFKE